MAALSAYNSTEKTSFHVLREKGYQVWKKKDLYMAEKDGWDFAAHEMVELLGVVAVFENMRPARYAEYWWMISEPWLLKNLPLEPRPYKPVWKMRKGTDGGNPETFGTDEF